MSCIFIVIVAFSLFSCGSIPLRSIYQLMNLDVLDLSPNEVRVVAVTSQDFQVTELYLRLIISSESGSKREIYPLKIHPVSIDNSSANMSGLSDKLMSDERAFILSLSEESIEKLSEQQAQIKRDRKSAKKQNKYSFGVTIANGCLYTESALNHAPISLYLKPSTGADFIHLLLNFDLSKQNLKPYRNLSEWNICSG